MSDVVIRQLEESDLFNGFLESLDSLRMASNLESQKAKKILHNIKSNPNHIIAVAIIDGVIVGSTTLLIEPKFIHNGGLVGHIEDVVVNKKHQKNGIGEKLVQYLLDFAKNKGCYKTILDCDDKVRPFYEKIGFKHTSNCMRFDHI